MDYKAQLDPNRIPKHIAIIMDGNGRWAQEKGENRVIGHQYGVLSVRKTVEICAEIGVDYLTLYAFSTENWNRPKYEVDALMELLVSALRKEIDLLKSNNVRLQIIGDLAALPPKCQNELQEGMNILAECTGLTLVLALSYSSKWEITQMVRQIADKVNNGQLALSSINEEVIHEHLCTSAIPDPELLIRTSGEQRISNFLLYQIAYSELYFTPIHWPDFDQNELLKAVVDYQQRERRFGKTSEQLQHNA